MIERFPVPRDNDPEPVASTRTLLRVEEVADRLAIGRTTAYALIDAGDLRSVRIGRAVRVTVSDLDAYVRSLRGPRG